MEVYIKSKSVDNSSGIVFLFFHFVCVCVCVCALFLQLIE